MLITFIVANFRSFREPQQLSMVAGSGTEHQDTHTFDPKVTNVERLLKSAVIYGPNAAGKTNLLKALQCMQSIIVNSSSSNVGAAVAYNPFKFDILTHASPSTFEISFIENEVRYEYSFALDAKRVYSEKLTEFHTKHPRRLFERSYDPQNDTYKWSFSKGLTGNRSVWREATRPDALFLSTAIQLNNTQLLPVFWWFQKRLVTIVGATQLNLGVTLHMLGQLGGKDRLLPFIREADAGIADIQFTGEPFMPQAFLPQQGVLPMFYQEGPSSHPKIAKVTFSHQMKQSKEPVELDFIEESEGTKMLFRTAGAWLNVLLNGEVLLVDEIDTSLHPLLVRFLIDRFHSEKTNPRHAQIVFTTHNTSILTLEMFRRDQIWFVEKGTENSSKLYPLSDFSPRKDEVIENWYMRGRYGALPIIEELAP